MTAVMTVKMTLQLLMRRMVRWRNKVKATLTITVALFGEDMDSYYGSENSAVKCSTHSVCAFVISSVENSS
jgi:hypothetical protein